jgi:hypothetical protein
MYDNATKDQFIELRARGIPYADIAEQLRVDKSTLVRWNQQFGFRILNLRQMRLEQLQQKILGSQEQQFEDLAVEYHRYHDALKTRNPDRIPQHTLFHITCRLRDQLQKRLVVPRFYPEPDDSYPSEARP